jgi:hypothetical protein
MNSRSSFLRFTPNERRVNGVYWQHQGVHVFGPILGQALRTDAFGPVVQACDGRVFTLATLPQMLTVDPFPAIAATPS